MPTERSPEKGPPRGAADQTRPRSDKPPAQTDQFMTQMQAMLAGMEGRLSQATANLQTSVTGQIGDLKERVKKNEDRMDKIHSEMGQMVETRIEEGLRKFMGLPGDGTEGCATATVGSDGSSLTYASALSRGASTSQSLTTLSNCPREAGNQDDRSFAGRKEEEYWKCRCSLRLRPVGQGDGVEEARKFMTEYLKLGEDVVGRLGPFSAVRVAFGPKTRHQKELLVTFDSVEARDVVRSSAANLAGKAPDVGIRLEVPRHLKSVDAVPAVYVL